MKKQNKSKASCKREVGRKKQPVYLEFFHILFLLHLNEVENWEVLWSKATNGDKTSKSFYNHKHLYNLYCSTT